MPVSIDEVRAALREAMGWNWLDFENLPPRAVIEQCYRALGEPIPNEFAARLAERSSAEN